MDETFPCFSEAFCLAGKWVTQIVDTVNGTITRTYDGLDRLTSETTPKGSVSYTYDNANRRSTMTVAGQSAVSCTYDNANRLTQITQGTATMTIGYDNANRRTSLTFPKRVAAAYGYDAASRVTSITYTERSNTIGTLTYTYDANGRRASMSGSLAKVNLPAAVTSAIYNANNQLTNWNGTTRSYDLDGNMTSDGATAYTWDARNRLAAFGSTTFTYDSFGRRTRNATGKAFLYDGVKAVQELSGSTVTANLLTGGVDEVFTRSDSAGARYLLTDTLGSTLALTDSTGAVQTQYSYEPFGKTTSSGPSNTSTFQYARPLVLCIAARISVQGNVLGIYSDGETFSQTRWTKSLPRSAVRVTAYRAGAPSSRAWSADNSPWIRSGPPGRARAR